MKLITRSAIGSSLQTRLLTGIPFKLTPSTTLNELLGIEQGILPPQGIWPNLKYFAIGNGGHRFSVGANNIPKPEPVQHMATDCGLYNQIPIVLRETNNDLTPAQMALFRGRRPETHNGVSYIAYYIGTLDYTNVDVQMNQVTIVNGTTTVVPWVPNDSNLKPTPPALSNTGVNVTDGTYIQVSARVPLTLADWIADEIVNVANILYQDPDLSMISEIMLATGVDRVVQTPGGGGTTPLSYTEGIVLQSSSIFNSFYAMQFANDGVTINLDIGATEPLLRLASSPT